MPKWDYRVENIDTIDSSQTQKRLIGLGYSGWELVNAVVTQVGKETQLMVDLTKDPSGKSRATAPGALSHQEVPVCGTQFYFKRPASN